MVVVPNSAVKNNLVAAWREFFVVEDGMLEVPLLPATLAAIDVTRFFTLEDHSLGEIATPEDPIPHPLHRWRVLQSRPRQYLQHRVTSSASQVRPLRLPLFVDLRNLLCALGLSLGWSVRSQKSPVLRTSSQG